jgi:hypothetical protein
MKTVNQIIRTSFFAAIFLFTACAGESAAERKLTDTAPPDYVISVIEGCEYFRFNSTHGYKHIEHKGNCRNPIHCYNDTSRTK